MNLIQTVNMDNMRCKNIKNALFIEKAVLELIIEMGCFGYDIVILIDFQIMS